MLLSGFLATELESNVDSADVNLSLTNNNHNVQKRTSECVFIV